MKLRVLVENNTKIDQYYYGEPGLCLYMEEDNRKILLDTGYSDIFMCNAEKMGIDLNKVDTIIFSHGHNDHTRGFKYLARETNLSNVNIIAHPLTFNKKVFIEDDGYVDDISAPFRAETIAKHCKLTLSRKPVQITDNLVYLGEIPVSCDFEPRKALGQYQPMESDTFDDPKSWPEDLCLDDSALAYKTHEGIFIITGCSHSGICNICEQAKKVCGDERIVGIIGGFHMFKKDERLAATIKYFKENNIEKLYPCHCVSFKAKAAIHNEIPIHEVAVGLQIEI